MTKKKFVPLTSLDNLTDEQKTEYKINACEYFEIPPELSLLEFMWLDSGDAGRHLVLYAKKGATDIMRGNRGICVDSIKETIGDGFIMFTATGHDKTGRVDVAVGAADTKGRSGKGLSDAIMTAQTRATRRLTLQFVGGGLLDESEVQSTTTDIVRATQPLAEIAAPAKLSPNAAPGRDITQEKKSVEVETEVHYTIPASAVGAVASPPLEGTTVPIPVEVSAPKKRRRRKGEVVLESPGQEVPAAPVNGPTAAQEAAALALAGVNATKLAVAAAVVPEPPSPPVAIVETPVPTPVVRKDQPNDGQKKVFKERLFVYTNTVLRQGKMVPCEGIGGVERKVALFVQTMFADAKETKYLTVNQWETFLGYLDEKSAELGAEGLVKLINEKIGAKE